MANHARFIQIMTTAIATAAAVVCLALSVPDLSSNQRLLAPMVAAIPLGSRR